MQIFKAKFSLFPDAREAWLGRIAAGELPGFPTTTRALRGADWQLEPGPTPPALCVSGLESAGEAAALATRLARLAAGGGLRLRADTLHGTFEIEEILHELKDLVSEVQVDCDGYLFSYVQAFHAFPACVLPDRADITRESHLLRSYLRLLARVCARRGTQLIGGTVDDDPAEEPGGDAVVEAADLVQVPHGRITEDGIRAAIRTAVTYLGRHAAGAADPANLEQLDETAAAELARAQLWQWVQHPTGVLDHGEIVTPDLFRRLLEEETEALHGETDGADPEQAAERLAAIVLCESFTMHALCEFPGQGPAG